MKGDGTGAGGGTVTGAGTGAGVSVMAGANLDMLKPFIKGIDVNVKGGVMEVVMKFDFGSEEIAKSMAVAMGQQLKAMFG